MLLFAGWHLVSAERSRCASAEYCRIHLMHFLRLYLDLLPQRSSVMQSVEGAPRAILMWRSFSHWVGGMGVLVFMLALLPMAEPSSMHLMKAESPGPSVGKLVPKVRSTAKILYQIYFVLTVAMLACMILTGCPLFDSVNLTFATAGTGGFGVLDSSAAEYGAATQWVMTIFMILFGVNFNVYFLFYVKRFKEGMKSEEARAYLGIIASAVLLISVNIFYMVRNLELTVRQAAFRWHRSSRLRDFQAWTLTCGRSFPKAFWFCLCFAEPAQEVPAVV